MNAPLPQGPPAQGWRGNMPDFNRDRLGFLLRMAREYGDFVPMRFATRRVFLVSDPTAIESVLVTHYKNFIKGPALSRNRLLFGNGLLVSEGDFWRKQRKLIQPAFHRQRIASYAETMASFAQRQSERWQDGETRDIHVEMTQLTLDIAVKTLFSIDPDTHGIHVGENFKHTQEAIMGRINSLMLLPEWVPTPNNQRMKRAVQELDRTVYSLIRQRRQSGEDTGDLLSMLLRLQDEDDGSQMTDRQIRDEVLTLFLAGHDTTALTLSWALYLLATHPEAEHRLMAEVQTVLNGRLPTEADKATLVYTEQVILETMRLYPPAWTVGRMALQACEIGGYAIPVKSVVIMSQWVVHRDPRVFPEPESFRPERWDGDFVKRIHKYAYFPFGGGPRVCIGNTFALMEAVLVLATLMQSCQFQLVPGQTIEPLPTFTVRPNNGIYMRVSQK